MGYNVSLPFNIRPTYVAACVPRNTKRTAWQDCDTVWLTPAGYGDGMATPRRRQGQHRNDYGYVILLLVQRSKMEGEGVVYSGCLLCQSQHSVLEHGRYIGYNGSDH